MKMAKFGSVVFEYVFCSVCGARLGNPLRLSLFVFWHRIGGVCDDCRKGL
jgi:hypothetical protein